MHPNYQHLIGDTSVPVIFVEGIKKADSLVTAARAAGVDVLVVAVAGVWNWLSEGEPIPDMFEIPVEGRRVTVCYDSDQLTNPNQLALQHLAEHLTPRGASVFVTYFPEQDDGSKMGADNFFAAGHTFQELRLLTRSYHLADFVTVRLNRSERFRLAVEDLERKLWRKEWKGQGGHTDRDVYLKLIEAAKQHGKLHSDGLRVVKSWGALELEARVSRGWACDALRPTPIVEAMCDQRCQGNTGR